MTDGRLMIYEGGVWRFAGYGAQGDSGFSGLSGRVGPSGPSGPGLLSTVGIDVNKDWSGYSLWNVGAVSCGAIITKLGGTITTGISGYLIPCSAQYAEPTATTRSSGTKMIYFSQISADKCDYATGVGTSGNIWFTMGDSAAGCFEFYRPTGAGNAITRLGRLSAAGVLEILANITVPTGYFATAISAGSGVLGADLWMATGKNIKVNALNPFRTIILTPGGGRPNSVSGCSAYSANVIGGMLEEYGTLDFNAATNSYAQWNLVMPTNYDGAGIYATFLWTAVSGTATQTVWWFCQGRAFGDTDAISGAFGTAVSSVDAYATSGTVHISPETAAMTLAGTPTGGEYVVLRVYRDVGDTLAANAKLLGVKIRYGISSYSD